MKILVLTSIYPNAESTKGTTPVVHYFCQEWVKQGHKVVVIHNDNKYLLFFYILPEFIKRYIESRFGVVLPNMATRKDKFFEKDGVLILRMPMLKIIPFGKFSKNRLNNQIKKINSFLDKENFKPDVITGHWENPQIDLIFKLKKRYCNVKTSLIVHTVGYLADKNMRNKLLSFDSIGFRNKKLLNNFEQNYLIETKNLYLCPSGLPNIFFESINYTNIEFKFKIEVLTIVYVGIFQKRKFPESIIKAVYSAKEEIDIKVDFIGEGNELKKVKKLVNEYKLDDKVVFHNRVSRDSVKEILLRNQVFVMISENEAFGLVYLEAMSCGCIVIASKNEGFDGIINDGFNGFLCKAGDDVELFQILLKIDKLSLEEKTLISKNAIDTASVLTNEYVSKQYLKNLLAESSK
jgi:glycosyltransferase involved in cell wall biosynthesis